MKVDQFYHYDVIYLNNSPHVLRFYSLDANGEKTLIGQKVYKPVTGNMADEQARKLFE